METVVARITVKELLHALTGIHPRQKTGTFTPPYPMFYMGRRVATIKIERYGKVSYLSSDDKLMAVFDNEAYLDD
jgi:hypothetical protein